MPEAALKKMLDGAEGEFLTIKPRVLPEIADRIVALRISGLEVQRHYRRHYPDADVTSQLLGFNKTPAFSLAAGETKSFTLTIPGSAAKTYLKVVADNDKQVAESVESNNILDTMNSCIQ